MKTLLFLLCPTPILGSVIMLFEVSFRKLLTGEKLSPLGRRVLRQIAIAGLWADFSIIGGIFIRGFLRPILFYYGKQRHRLLKGQTMKPNVKAMQPTPQTNIVRSSNNQPQENTPLQRQTPNPRPNPRSIPSYQPTENSTPTNDEAPKTQSISSSSYKPNTSPKQTPTQQTPQSQPMAVQPPPLIKKNELIKPVIEDTKQEAQTGIKEKIQSELQDEKIDSLLIKSIKHIFNPKDPKDQIENP